MIGRAWAAPLVAAVTLTACAVHPDEMNLRDSFAEQIASVAGVTAFERDATF